MYPNIPRLLLNSVVLSLAFLVSARVTAQSVTEIITDYNGYWKSGSGAVNAVKPDNSHNLVSFSFNGTRYSTGVNDDLLTQHGLTFKAGDFQALPVRNLPAASGNTKIGLGALYDGVVSGAPATKPENNMIKYLTDGANGLDLGTGVANIPTGDFFMPITELKKSNIGDGNPDLLITQVADPSGSNLDRYEFTDANGNTVGNSVTITVNTLPSLGKWTADFYTPASNAMVLDAGFMQTDRDIRLWAADFSSFGINNSNVNQIAYLKVSLNGNSDLAFVAYNNKTMNIMGSILPTQMGYFRGKAALQQVSLNWQTLTEINSDRFLIERSVHGNQFATIDSVKAAGTSAAPRLYAYADTKAPAGKVYYRLKIVDNNGKIAYSEIIQVINGAAPAMQVSLFPNPTTDRLYVKHSATAANEQYFITNMQGHVVLRKSQAAGSVQQVIDVQQLPKGTYTLVWTNGREQQASTFIRN
jgi:hypothetical protein